MMIANCVKLLTTLGNTLGNTFSINLFIFPLFYFSLNKLLICPLFIVSKAVVVVVVMFRYGVGLRGLKHGHALICAL